MPRVLMQNFSVLPIDKEGFHRQQLKPVDVVMGGGGFVGLTLAKEITARTSLKVLVLERGQPRKLSDYVTGMDESDQALRFRMMQNLAEKTLARADSPPGLRLPAATRVRQAGDSWRRVPTPACWIRQVCRRSP